jgi:hypothetical protein
MTYKLLIAGMLSLCLQTLSAGETDTATEQTAQAVADPVTQTTSETPPSEIQATATGNEEPATGGAEPDCE